MYERRLSVEHTSLKCKPVEQIAQVLLLACQAGEVVHGKRTPRQGVPRTGSGLPEQLVVRARSLKDRQPFALSPDDQPVAGVGHVALPAARPASFEVVHAVPSAQLLERFRRVLGEQG